MMDFMYVLFFGDGSAQQAILPLLLPLAISAISGIAGGLANRKQKATQESTSTSTTTPNLDPTTMGFRDQIINNYMSSIANPLDTHGYEASGIDDINHLSELQAQKTKENLAARGVRGPAEAFALNNVDANRFSNITKFKQSVPLLRQKMESDILANAGNFFSAIPHGTTQSTKSTGEQTTPGNVAAGSLGNFASTFANLLGQGAFKKAVA